MSSTAAPSAIAPSPTSESSSTSSNATPNSIHPHEKPSYPPPLMPNQLNNNFDVDTMNSPSCLMLDNKENKDDTNTINNNRNYSHVMNSNSSSTATIVGSTNVGALKIASISNNMGFPSNTCDESKRSCNRCQNCHGFSSHEWRNTCTSCRCPRSSHDISIGARCCGFHRAGLDPTSAAPSSNQSTQIQKNNSLSTISNASSTSSSTSKSQIAPSIQPPPPSGTAPAMDTTSTISNNGNPVNTVLSGVSCSRTSAAEAAGYSWMPHVRCFAL